MYTPEFLELLKKIEERFSVYILVKNKLLEMQGMGYRDRVFPPVDVRDVIDLDSTGDENLPIIDAENGITKSDFSAEREVSVLVFDNPISVKIVRKLTMYKGIIGSTKPELYKLLTNDGFDDFQIPFLKDTPNLLSLPDVSRFFGSWREANHYAWRKRDDLGKILADDTTFLAKFTGQNLKLVDFSDRDTIERFLDVIEGFTYEKFFLSKEGYYFRRFILGTRSVEGGQSTVDEILNNYKSNGVFGEIYGNHGQMDFEYHFKRKTYHFPFILRDNHEGNMFKGDLSAGGKLSPMQYIQQTLLPKIQDEIEWHNEQLALMLDEARSNPRKYRIARNIPGGPMIENFTERSDSRLYKRLRNISYMPEVVLRKDLSTYLLKDETELETTTFEDLVNIYFEEGKKGFYDYSFAEEVKRHRDILNALEKYLDPNEIDKLLRSAWGFCQFTYYELFHNGFHNGNLQRNERGQEYRNPPLEHNHFNPIEVSLRPLKQYYGSSQELKTRRVSSYTTDYAIVDFLEEVVIPYFMPGVDGYVYFKQTNTAFHPEVFIFKDSAGRIKYNGCIHKNPNGLKPGQLTFQERLRSGLFNLSID